MSKPTFIGIGVQKCASTWVHRILEDHPQIVVSEPKELDFFSYHYHFGFAWYRKHFLGSGVSGENSPSYFCDSRVAERVHQYHPSIKIIVCLRDPIARIVSHHAHEVRLGHVDANMPFYDALENNPMYMEQSLYARHLKVWLDMFSREQVLILLQEDIQQRPEEIASEVYNFLGVNTDFESAFLTRKANASQIAKSKGVENILKKSARCLRQLGLDTFIKTIKNVSWVRSLRQKNMQDIQVLLPEMTDLDISKLDAVLKADMIQLQALTGLDLSAWATWRRVTDAG